MLLLYSTLFVILSLCTCPVTSLRACGGELTNLLMEHCGEVKRMVPPIKRMGSDSESFENNELEENDWYPDVFQKVLISKLQQLMEEWRKRHSYEVNVRGLRIRRRRRAVTVSGFLDQCCQSGCRLSDLVSVGFC